MKYGLPNAAWEQIKDVLSRHPAVTRAWVYGSRAMQTHRPGSDIDLALEGNDLSYDEVLMIQIHLDELGFLYEFDVKDVKRIKNPALLDHIRQVGSVVYETRTLHPTP